MEKVRNIKTLLAKLMATENITVKHQAVQTASFDPVNRVLTIPVYKDDLSNDELDLFVGHEVGHALFTPSAPIDSYVKGRKYFKEFLNIVEDARIEKLIQRRFPGLRKNFVGGYNGLVDRGFFGKENPNDYNFIDRINVFFKTGDTRIEFSDEEQVFVDAIKNLEDWDSTIDLTEKLFEYCGTKGQEKEEEELAQQMSSETASPDDNGEEMDIEESQSSNEQSDNSSDEEEKGQGESDGDGEETNEQSNEQSTADTDDDGIEENEASENQGVGNDEEMKSQTTIDFEKGMQELVENNIDDVYEANLYKVPAQVTSIEKINNLIDESINGGNSSQFIRYFEVADAEEIETKLAGLHSEFVSSQKSVLNYMVKEFEMKKKADEYKRTREAKTGTLNMSKLYNYKFSEDLFLKNNITKDGKSHGMVMLVDWSGSMYGQIEDVLQQVQILTAFCQKVNIPFDVYAFTDQMTESHNYGYDEEFAEGNWRLGHGFSLLHLASSSFNRNQKELSNKALAFFKEIFSRNSQYGTIMMNRMERQLHLGQTPLASGLLSMFPILTQFQNRTNVDILNLVCLTDGEGQCRINFDQAGKRGTLAYGWRSTGHFILKGNKADYRIKDYKTEDDREWNRPVARGPVHRSNLVETNLYDILRKEFANLRITGFYLAENDRMAVYRIYNSYVVDHNNCIDKYQDSGKLAIKSYKDKKFIKVPYDTFQYDNLFIVKGSSLDLDDTWQVDEATVKSTAKLRKSFSKMMSNKVSDRVLASNFIEVIA